MEEFLGITPVSNVLHKLDLYARGNTVKCFRKSQNNLLHSFHSESTNQQSCKTCSCQMKVNYFGPGCANKLKLNIILGTPIVIKLW